MAQVIFEIQSPDDERVFREAMARASACATSMLLVRTSIVAGVVSKSIDSRCRNAIAVFKALKPTEPSDD